MIDFKRKHSSRPLLLGSLFIIALSAALFLLGKQTIAQMFLFEFQSETLMYSANFPEKPKETVHKMRTTDETLIVSSETMLTIDQRPFAENTKQFIIKMDQTIGTSFTKSELEVLEEKEMNDYVNFYKDAGWVVKRKGDEVSVAGGKGREFVAYLNENTDKNYGVRIRVFFSNATRYQQIFMGPISSLFAFQTEKYFSTFRFKDGVIYDEGEIDKNWITYTPDDPVFSVLLPALAPPYIANEPVIQSGPRLTVLKTIFYDPVFRHNVPYNVYAYRFPRILSQSNVKQVIIDRHVTPHGHLSRVPFQITTFDGSVQIDILLAVKLPEYSSVQRKKIRAFYSGQYLVVQEMFKSDKLSSSPLLDSIFENIIFHPDRAELKRRRAETKSHAPQEQQYTKTNDAAE